jgi:hypothetical protein
MSLPEIRMLWGESLSRLYDWYSTGATVIYRLKFAFKSGPRIPALSVSPYRN